MKRRAIVLAAIILAAGSVDAVCIACGSGSSTGSIKWNMTGVTDERNRSVYCIGEQINFSFKSLNTLRYLDGVRIYAYRNDTRVGEAVSGFDGAASYTPKETGSYRLVMERRGYRDIAANLEVGSCQRRQDTTTSTTTTSLSTTTTASTTSSTTTTTTTTTTRPASLERTDPDLASAAFLVLAVAVLAAAALFLKKRF